MLTLFTSPQFKSIFYHNTSVLLFHYVNGEVAIHITCLIGIDCNNDQKAQVSLIVTPNPTGYKVGLYAYFYQVA